MTLLAPIFALAALALIPIVLLYLLKMKRQERVISSTLLWRQTIKDLEANVPFQKLRANLLLILQVLTLALLVFALMRPALPAVYRLSDRSVLVLDVSASMLAGDAEGGSRFERAQAIAGNLIDSLQEGQRMMVLAGDRMVTDGFLEDRRRLREIVRGLGAEESESDCATALQLAYTSLSVGQSGAPARPQGRIYLVSDGAGLALPPELEDIGDYLTYFTVGTTGDNAGIIGLQFRRPLDETERGQLFVNVGNFGERARELVVTLRRANDNAVVDAQKIGLKADQSSGVTFERPFAAGDYVVTIDGEDALALDDRAYLALGPNRPLRVLLVSTGHPVFEQFLSAASNVEAARIEPEKFTSAGEPADLYIFDRFVPEAAPRERTLVLHAPGSACGAFEPVGVLEGAAVFDWTRDDAVMRFVSLSDVRLAASSAVRLAANPKIVPLVWTHDNQALVGYASAGPVRHYVIAFEVSRSTWPQTVGFPLFMGNVMKEARRAQRLGEALVGKTGRLWRLSPLVAGETARVETPGGGTVDVSAPDVGADFRETQRAGFYVVRSAGGAPGFALNLDSVRESKIVPQEELRGLGGEKVVGESEVARGQRDIWPWVAALALAMLVLEWYVYHRRIG